MVLNGMQKIHRHLMFGQKFVLALPLSIAAAAAVHAETACVRCTGPDAVYSCETTRPDGSPVNGAGLYCASRLASERGHVACASQRNADGCTGTPVQFVYTEDSGPSQIGVNAAAESESGQETPQGEPATLGAFAKDTYHASTETVKKAGDNIGDAASKAGQATGDAIKGAGKAIGAATKKTLKCLGSALNDC